MKDEKQKELDAVKEYVLGTQISHLNLEVAEEDKEEIIKEYGSLEEYYRKVEQDVYDCFGRHSSVL